MNTAVLVALVRLLWPVDGMVCVSYKAEGQMEPSSRTCSQLYTPTVAVELIDPVIVTCDQVPEGPCLRLPAAHLQQIGDGWWAMLSDSEGCPPAGLDIDRR